MNKAIVIEANEFKEIINDFTSPLEILREAIQNSWDAKAKNFIIDISLNETATGQSLDLIFEDDGEGVRKEHFPNFFNLGDSTKKDDISTIGEKGHGTKIFFNSEELVLESWYDGKKYSAMLERPFGKIFGGEDLLWDGPKSEISDELTTSGTRISIKGYMKSTTSEVMQFFSHPSAKDYIKWFTIFGSIENQFDKNKHSKKKLMLRTHDTNEKQVQNDYKYSINVDGFEEIYFGHVFPENEIYKQSDLKKIAEKYKERYWEDYFCKKVYCDSFHIDGLKQNVFIVIWAEGDKQKRLYNPLIRERFTAKTREFEYKVSDRYGFWACKDFIPIQHIDDWISGKGTYTKFHAFVNFNGFSLTANRSSIENTKPEYLRRLKEKISQIFDELLKDKEYRMWLDVGETASQERSADEEKKEFSTRIKACKGKKSFYIGKVKYFEPNYEGEVALIYNALLHKYPDILKAEILDYSTHKGVDFLIRENIDVPLENDSTVGYLELKLNLEKTRFNHSFEKLTHIACYNIKGFRAGETLVDINGKKLELKKLENSNEWKLVDSFGEVNHSIRIFVIEDFLKDKGLFKNEKASK